MVRTYLPLDLRSKIEIVDIFTRIAESIHKDMPNIRVEKDGIPITLDSVKNVREFLLAEDFYSYHFVGMKDFWFDLFRLDGKCKVKNIVSEIATCKSIASFHDRYPLDRFSLAYARLRPFSDLRISKLKNGDHPFPELYTPQLVEKAFSYSKLNPEERHQILVAMDVPVCPYCNMNYTIDFLNGSQPKSTADIDHFYLKTEYPEYSLCLYNFVPSCQVCNSRLKRTHSMDRNHFVFPHEESFEKKSNFEISNIIQCLLGDENTPTLILEEVCKDMAVKNSTEVFKIEERYQYFSGYARDLLNKYMSYSDLYIRDLEDQFNALFSEEQIKVLIFGSLKTEEEFCRESLGKLRRDLLVQLGVYQNSEI